MISLIMHASLPVQLIMALLVALSVIHGALSSAN